MMSEIAIYRRDVQIARSLVDPDDAEWLSDVRWSLGTDGYASRVVMVAGRQRRVLMHREILGLTFGDKGQCDHKNRDRLDNRRSNLRVVSHAENMQNKGASRGSQSRFRAVYFCGDRPRPWRARPALNGTYFHLGYFQDEVDAAFAVEAFRAAKMPHVIRDPALP